MAAGNRKTIVLKDPQALRALAHPARQTLIHELFSGRVLTATQAAELVDLTPSAVSHHLRALEKWGLVRRAPSSGDGRERPWEGTARSLRIETSEATGSREAINSVLTTRLDAVARAINEFIQAGEDQWSDAYQGLSTAGLWLTEDETRDVTETISALDARYAKGRSHRRHPRGARHASFAWSLVPLEPPPDPS